MGGITSVDLDKSTLIDRIVSEGSMGASAVARKLGAIRGGRGVHPSSVMRWYKAGRLEGFILNGKLVTSWPSVLRYLTSQQDNAPVPAQAPRSPAARSKAAEEAARELEKLGA